MPRPICQVLRLGLLPYPQACELQNSLAVQIAAGECPPALLLLEHPHTYTFGRRGGADHLIWDQAELERRGIQVCCSDRGGDITYHGPGQLVGYPLIQLSTAGLHTDQNSTRLPQADYLGYVRRLEDVLIRALQRIGVTAQRVSGLTGVWVPAPSHSPPTKILPAGLAKIASLGVKVDVHGVTRHGFALNVHPDMACWQGIIPCGLPGVSVTSLAELLPEPPSLETVTGFVVQAFGEIFDFQMSELSRTKHIPPG